MVSNRGVGGLCEWYSPLSESDATMHGLLLTCRPESRSTVNSMAAENWQEAGGGGRMRKGRGKNRQFGSFPRERDEQSAGFSARIWSPDQVFL